MTRPARWMHWLPLLAGPLALTGFLLPWTAGAGVFAGETYSGLDLVRLTGVLGALELRIEQGAALLAVRALIVGVPIAAAWVTLLSPRHRWHWAYPAAAAYLVVTAVSVALARLIVAGEFVPLPGPALLLAASAALIAPHLSRRDRPVAVPRPMPSPH